MAVITGDGVLVADSATLSGIGVAGIGGTGDLDVGFAVLNGAGAIDHDGVGTLVSSDATLVGIGNASNVGVLVAGITSLEGFGYIDHAGTGSLAADAAIMSGVGNLGDTGELYASPATLAASGQLGHTGTGDLLAGDAVLFALGTRGSAPGTAALVAGAATLLGYANFVFPVTGRVPWGVAVTGNFPAAAKLSGRVPWVVAVTGNFKLTEAAQASLESTFESTGYRPSFPLTVYELAAVLPTQVDDEVPIGRSFIVSGAFAAGPGNALYDAGASANYIGTKVPNSTGGTYLVFRKPREFEVVWHVPDQTLYRYTLNRDTGQFAWKKYRSLPERAWADQVVGPMLDPDGVYAYYCRLLGALMWRWAYDTEKLVDQLNGELASPFYLPALAFRTGIALPADAELSVRRFLVRTAVPVFKKKGLDEAVSLRLQALGYRGHALEIWANPDNPANLGYYPLTPLNNAGDPSCGFSGAGVDYIERPHGSVVTDQNPYFLTSRISVYVSNQDGSPVDFAALGSAFKNKIYNALRFEVLPVHVDIRHFGTVASLDAESVTVSDSLSVFTV